MHAVDVIFQTDLFEKSASAASRRNENFLHDSICSHIHWAHSPPLVLVPPYGSENPSFQKGGTSHLFTTSEDKKLVQSMKTPRNKASKAPTKKHKGVPKPYLPKSKAPKRNTPLPPITPFEERTAGGIASQGLNITEPPTFFP